MSTLFVLVIGIFIGWNLPQPDWAKALQARLLDIVRGMNNRQ